MAGTSQQMFGKAGPSCLACGKEQQVFLCCRMTVVEGWFGGAKHDKVPAAAELNEGHLELIKVNAAINSQVRYLSL